MIPHSAASCDAQWWVVYRMSRGCPKLLLAKSTNMSPGCKQRADIAEKLEGGWKLTAGNLNFA